MKKYLITLIAVLTFLPAVATEPTYSNIESVKSFAKPIDARFQYGLPDKNSFKKHHDAKASTTEGDSGEIVLDTSKAKPQKKIIKRLSPDADLENLDNNIDNSTMPMNYDNFPKFYDPNSMTQNQFLPMTSF